MYPGDPGRLGSVGDHARRDFSRAAQLLQRSERSRTPIVATEVFLFVHLRILFQPLRRGSVPAYHAIQTVISGLARIFDFPIRAGVGVKRLYGGVREPTIGHSARGVGNQVERSGSPVKNRESRVGEGGVSPAKK